MHRYLSVFKNAGLMVWNLALLAFFAGLPLLLVIKAGWLGMGALLAGAVAVWLARHPLALLGLWLGLGL